MNTSILPFKVLRAKYRNNGRQDITTTLNGTVNGGKTYFNQSSQELIPNGSTVTEKGRIRDRSWSARRGQTSRQSVLWSGFFHGTVRRVKPKGTRSSLFGGKARGLFQVKFDDSTVIRLLNIRWWDINSTESPRCISPNRDMCYQAVKRATWKRE